MAAASSIQPPSVHSAVARESTLLTPEMDSPESRRQEEEEAAVQPSEPGVSLRELPELDPEEIERRLAKTRQELSNRRKILIKNLPPDTTNQEVHEILKEYELKYCFVDRNKGTAFVTLLNGDQAQDAIRSLHHSTQFEELVRAYGNIERSFLVYSELTGHSKGYGFVEYMKKDSASRARSELLGRPLGDRSLMVQWMDVNQLSQEENLHSKCVCVDRLPLDLCDSEELTQLFSETYKPVFCQLAQDEGSPVRGFGVVEYESAEQAEAVLTEMDRTVVMGQVGMILSNRKGLLPEPNIAQLLTSMTNPAALQILMRPYNTGKRGGKFAHHSSLPFLRPPLTAALLTLGKAHQSAMLGNGLVLQNLLHMQLAQQQLLHIKDKRVSSVASLLGDPSKLLMQKALSLRPPGLVALGKGLLGDSPSELGQEAAPVPSHNSPAGVMPYLQPRVSTGEHNSAPAPTVPCSSSAITTSSSTSSSSSGCTDRQPAPPGTVVNNGQSSLLGDPPKEVRLPSNPYLNLASVMPSVVLQGSMGAKAPSGPPGAAVYTGPVAPVVSQTSSSFSHSAATTSAPYSTDTSTDYSQYSQAYTQEAMQQWYQHYQAAAQAHTYSTAPPDATAAEYAKDHTQAPPASSYADYNSYMQAVTQYYSQPATATQAYATKEVDVCKPLGVSIHAHPAPGAWVPRPPHPAAAPQPGRHTHAAAPDWSSYYYNQARGHKREYPQLAVPEVAPAEGAYIGQHSQGLGGQYADYFKRKRL
ncbi:hypothetical protein WMY93_024548 [Mugilogobius chulae]|uniref:RRM domain-containing protein n=1 Tax=Mugilogobius chulae TaxID=88201 RepID=A0AAW0N3A8_9GOBI